MTRPARILHVLGRMNRGGVETWLMHVLRNVDRSRYSFDFLVSSPEPSVYDAEILRLGSRIICCPNPRSLTYAARLRAAILANGPYDVVHSHLHHFSGVVLAAAASAGVKGRIAHSHNSLPNTPPTIARRTYLSATEALIGRFATRGLAASRAAARSLFGDNWQRDPRWSILLYGIDLAPFRETHDRAFVRDELGIPRDAFVVGNVGRLDPQKNHAFMLRITSELLLLEPRTHLVLVGEGSLRMQLEEEVRRRGLDGVVRFVGGRSDVPRVLRAFDTFLFPSHYEGLGLVGIEAQAAGIPLVVSESVPREIEVVGALVRWKSLDDTPADWAAALLASRKDPAPDPPQARGLVESSAFNVIRSAAALQHIYSDPNTLSRNPTPQRRSRHNA